MAGAPCREGDVAYGPLCLECFRKQRASRVVQILQLLGLMEGAAMARRGCIIVLVALGWTPPVLAAGSQDPKPVEIDRGEIPKSSKPPSRVPETVTSGVGFNVVLTPQGKAQLNTQHPCSGGQCVGQHILFKNLSVLHAFLEGRSVRYRVHYTIDGKIDVTRRAPSVTHSPSNKSSIAFTPARQRKFGHFPWRRPGPVRGSIGNPR